jgi:hypothetical protein
MNSLFFLFEILNLMFAALFDIFFSNGNLALSNAQIHHFNSNCEAAPVQRHCLQLLLLLSTYNPKNFFSLLFLIDFFCIKQKKRHNSSYRQQQKTNPL